MDEQLKLLILIYFICGWLIWYKIISRIFNPDKNKKKKEKKKGPSTSFLTGFARTIQRIPLFKGIFWEFTHFWMYFVLGYYSPNYWYLSTAIGYLFEHFEQYLNNDHNIPIYSSLGGDMFANSLGLLCGIVTRFS